VKMAELDRFMREAEVLEATSLARSTLWREVKAKRFPSPVQITPGRVGWRQSDINRWLENPMGWTPTRAA
ncbi:helix-turn-helix transcriptional regulator, partial [Pseudomonas aeruginosa]